MNAKYKKAFERFLELEKLVSDISKMEYIKPHEQNTFHLRELNMHLFKNKPPKMVKT